MKENLQTEQFLEPDEDQLQAIAGGDTALAFSTKLMNTSMSYGIYPKTVANMIQKQIGDNAQAGKTFEVNKSWTKPLTKIKA